MSDDVRLIDLGRGYSATVNSDTFCAKFLYEYDWKAQVHKRADKVYAVASVCGDRVYMHRLIAGAEQGEHVDHKDGDGLNNRDSNLRRCSPGSNRANSRAVRKNSSGLKGVTWHKSTNSWMSSINHKGMRYYLGLFAHKQRAAVAYDAAAKALNGEFAGLNYPTRRTRARMPSKGYKIGSRSFTNNL